MATSDKSPIRSITSEERHIVSSALELQAKSCDRASRASTNSVIASEYVRQAAQCRNLAAHFINASLDV